MDPWSFSIGILVTFCIKYYLCLIYPPLAAVYFPFGFWLLAFGFWLLAFGFALGIKFKFYWLKFFTNLPSGLFVGLPCCASSAKKFWAICSS